MLSNIFQYREPRYRRLCLKTIDEESRRSGDSRGSDEDDGIALGPSI
jgi:hypothetical protein